MSANNWVFLLPYFFSLIVLCYFPLQFGVVYLRSGWSFFSSVVVTALKDEATVLGMPAGILSARMAANLIEKISMESDQTTLLSAEHRVRGNMPVSCMAGWREAHSSCSGLAKEEMVVSGPETATGNSENCKLVEED